MSTIPPTEVADLISVAHALADAARPVTLRHFRSPGLSADHKGGSRFDPVTVADRASEQTMRAILAERRPLDGILGEEFAALASQNGLTWVLDPIDGTRSYMSGTPTWGVLIAVSDATGPLFGIIDQPYIGERFAGGFGVAEVAGPMGRVPLATLAPRPLSEATLFSTFPEVGTPAERQAFERVSGKVRLTRFGIDCYAYGLVAAGQIDLVIEAGLHPFDLHGPIAVVHAAGGVVTNWDGGPAHEGGQVIAAANASVHAEALALLQRR